MSNLVPDIVISPQSDVVEFNQIKESAIEDTIMGEADPEEKNKEISEKISGTAVPQNIEADKKNKEISETTINSGQESWVSTSNF